jgi:hypothetical protein
MDAGDWQSAAQAALTQSPVETRELVASLAGGCSSRCKSEAEPLAMPKRSASGASQRCVAGELEILFLAKVEGWPPVQANVLRKVRTGNSKQAWPGRRTSDVSRRLGKPGSRRITSGASRKLAIGGAGR